MNTFRRKAGLLASRCCLSALLPTRFCLSALLPTRCCLSALLATRFCLSALLPTRFCLSALLATGLAAILATGLLATPRAMAGTTPASAEDLAAFPKAPLVIESAGKRLTFDVWVSATPARREQGLMFVRVLPEKTGMLFLFPVSMHAGFWMKNTYIPLDLLFVRQNGTIARIAERARPHDLTAIPSGEPVLAVLELAGGSAAKFGLRPGDRVVSVALQPADQ